MKNNAVAVEKVTIKTYTGRYIDLLNPDPEMIHIDDIAASLPKLNRFNGHTFRPYTVAEHCLLGVEYCTPPNKLEFLMHDSTEAYLGDIAGPLKRTELFAGYRELEAKWWAAIAERFGLRVSLSKEVHTVDKRMLVTEQRDLVGRRPQSTDAYKPFIQPIGLEPYGLQEKFLAKFYELVGVTVGAKR